LSWGVAPVDRLPGLIDLIEEGKINTRFLCTHSVPLNEILKGYELFGNRTGGCLKVLITPWEP